MLNKIIYFVTVILSVIIVILLTIYCCNALKNYGLIMYVVTFTVLNIGMMGIKEIANIVAKRLDI